MSGALDDLSAEELEGMVDGLENEAGFLVLALAQLVSIFAFWFAFWPTYFGLDAMLGYGLASFFGVSGVFGYYLSFSYLSRT